MLQLPVFSVMEEKVTRELEHVSKIVLAQPQLVTPEQRHEAENVILQFRKTKLPYNICRYILENSKCDYVLFQAATTIKEGVVREWSLLSSDDIESLRSFLLRYITNHVSLQSYVREQILQTVAVILKRGTLDSKGADRDTLFTDITHLVSSGNVTMQLVACSMLTALLNEYSSSARTSNVGLTWEFHTKCKSTFEESDLKRVLLFALQVLNELEKQPSPLPREAMAVMNRMLSISEQVLSWEFTKKSGPRRFVGNFEMNPNVPLMPNDKWRNTLLDKSVIHLFFRIHRKVRHNQEMASHSLQCLTQLASLNGPVFPDDKARTEYLATYVDCFLQLLSCIDLQDYENLAVANIFKNIIMLFPMTCIVGLPGVLFDLMLQQLTHLTCSIGKAASMEEAMHKDDTIYMESYEKLLEAWMELVTGMKDIAPDKLKPHAQQVFNTYIQCHVSAPDGCRTQESVEAFDEIDEVEEDDRDRFCDQLCSIGILGRMVPDHSVPSLCRVLEDRVNKLNHHLQHLQHNYSISGAGLSVDQYLTTLYEDLHWIILMIAFLLTEESEGETPMIPSDIMSYSISQAGSIDLHTTLKLLGSPSESIDCIENAEYSSDSVVRLVSAVFRLCEVERKASETKLSEILSPQVGQSVMWFLRRWVVAYLLPDENYYSQVSQALLAAFGRDSDGAQWTVSFLLSKVLNNLAIWSSEDALTIDTLYLFCALLENRARAKYVTKCQLLWDLAQQQSEHKPPLSLMSHDAKRLLMKGLVVAGSGVEESVREDYWKCVLSSLQLRFFETVRDENMSKVGYQTKVKGLLLDYFECLCGVAQGSRIDNQEQLFNYFVPILADTIKVLDVYHDSEDVVQIILDLYSEVAQAQLCYLSMSNSRKFYELCLSTIQVYSKHNIGKKCRNASEEEENRYNDILLVIELLTHLLSKDYIDFSDPEESPVGETIEAVDVILYGLNIVIPLMTAELLTFPALCSQYFKLIALLAELHAEKFTCLPESLFHTLVTSMDLGLTSFGAEECNLCLESITALASHVYMDNQTSTPLHAAMPHFLKCVFKIMFKETFNMSFIETASAALFCLICCEQDHYRHLVNELLHSQTEPEYKQRLLEAFNNLTPPSLNLNISRQSKITFLQNFDEFLVNVRGFLCVK